MNLNFSFDYDDQIRDAVKNNNLEQLRDVLSKIGLIKNPNPIQDTFNDIHHYFKNLGKSSLSKSNELNRVQDTFRMIFAHSLDNKSPQIYKYIIESNELKIKFDLNHHSPWANAITINDFEIVKYLANIDKKNDKSKVIFKTLSFHTRCSLKMAKYLIDDKSMPFHESLNKLLKEYETYSTNIKEFTNLNVGTLFINTCRRRDRKIVYYLLKHETYGKMIDKSNFFEGICQACSSNNLKLLDYLLTDKNMLFKPYEDYDPKKLLQLAAKNREKDVLDYLIFDFQIPKPNNFLSFFDVDIISHHISSFSDQNEIDEFNKIVKYTHELFEKRDLHNELQVDLKPNNNPNKTVRKI